MVESNLLVSHFPILPLSHEEAKIKASSKDLLASIRAELAPFTHHTVRVYGGDAMVKIYYLKPPFFNHNTVSVYGIPFLVAGDLRRARPAEEVFRFELAELGEKRTRLSGECRQSLKELEEIFQHVWHGVVR